jgi:hypothetical protein
MKTGKCGLCNETRPLLNKSHIIPDFFYEQAGLYNEKHQIHKIEVQKFLKDKKVSFVPTGVYKGGILCAECDNILLGGLETYGRKALYGGLKENEEIICKNFKNPDNHFEFSICEKVDYKKFKLFLLSILWRSAISTKDLFQDVDISDEYLEILRKMILDGNPGKVNDFPIISISYLKDESIPYDFIGQPIKSVTDERILITFLLSGFIFIFTITPDSKDTESINNLTPSPDNRFGIMHIPQGHAWEFIMRYAKIIK